ncbi:MAG: glycerol-3-phosphate responsive antiterminator [Eubacterium sp.]|nr:glycerol-3-phosphate responsive antiterminator [Eubacterium sp.]
MKHREFIEQLEATPIVAAVKDERGLEDALRTDIGIIFILYGDVVTIPGIVEKVKDVGRTAFVHMDLIGGLLPKEPAVEYIRKSTKADGIITTRAKLIGPAADMGLLTVLRFFLLDSIALANVKKQGRPEMRQPDVIEVLPGIIVPKLMKEIRKASRVPVMAGGLITEKADVLNALEGGAIAISTTNEKVWVE